MWTVAIIAIAGILTAIASKTTYYLWKVLAGVAWVGLGVWLVTNPVGGDATSPAQTIFVLLGFFAGISCFFWSFWYSRREKGREGDIFAQENGGRFRLPFMNNEEQEEEEKRRRYLPTRNERVDAYHQRLESALRGERRRR